MRSRAGLSERNLVGPVRRFLAVAALAAPFASCGVADVDVYESDYVDHDMGEMRAGLLASAAGGCDTSIAAGLTVQLVEELNCIAPNLMVDFRGPGMSLSAATQPYLAPGAAAALKAAIAGKGTLSINSAYRSVAQQYLLKKWHSQGKCNIQAVADPGSSNHQSGRSIDINSYATWRSALESKGWRWYGSGDTVHFDFLSSPNLGDKSVLAFQRLWNKNKSNKLSEDGAWGSSTEAAMKQSPVEGFPIHGCAKPPQPPPPKPVDSGRPDAGLKDAGTVDAGVFDAGTSDAGTFDSFGPRDASEFNELEPVVGGCNAAPAGLLFAFAPWFTRRRKSPGSVPN